MARERAQVSVGEAIGPVTVPVTRQTLVDYANASGDQNPIHQDEEFAKQVGLPDVIAHGMWTMAAAAGVVADWAGDAGRVESVRTRFTAMVVVPRDGASVEVSGVVTDVTDDGVASIDITAVADGTKVLGRCSATVRLD
ncbi:MAG TPA: acyl dehydratase [Intrasporangiaceae bacterium]|nr:acyl dehydratase [Intrasporangiaceae bacterium]